MTKGFPCGSVSKESACNVGDLDWIRSLGWEDSLEKEKATHFSILAWRIPWAVKSMGSQRFGHDWETFTSLPWQRITQCKISVLLLLKYLDLDPNSFCPCQEPVRHSTHDKGHEEGGSAYAKAGSSLRSPPDILEHLPPKNQSLPILLLCALTSDFTEGCPPPPSRSLCQRVNLQLQLIKFLGS